MLFPAFYSICIAHFSPASPLFYLSSISPYCSLSLHESTLFCATHAHHLDSAERVTSYFLLCYTFLKVGPITVAPARTPVGDPPPTPETCGSGIFQTCAERYEGYFRAQKHVFKLDMAFNYFCGSVIS